jgi:hypothetical protein
VRQHGWSKRRTWRKLHIGVNEQNGEILTAVASTNDFRDDELLGDLIEPLEEVRLTQLSGDGIYDSRRCYGLLQKRGVYASIPPWHRARLADLKKKPELAQRNVHIQRIASLGRLGQNGRKKWKEEVGYHRRSLAETTFFRLKTLFTTRLSSRSFESQASELLLRCAVLNSMTQLGMPRSYAC